MAPSNSQAAASLMLRALLWWQSKARKDSLISHGRLAFCTATKILLAFISRAAGSTDQYYMTKVGHWRKDVSEGHTLFCFNFFLQKIFARLTSLFFLPLFAFETGWEVFLFQTVGRVINCSWHNIQRSNVSCILFSWLRGEVSGKRSFSLAYDLIRSPY